MLTFQLELRVACVFPCVKEPWFECFKSLLPSYLCISHHVTLLTPLFAFSNIQIFALLPITHTTATLTPFTKWKTNKPPKSKPHTDQLSLFFSDVNGKGFSQPIKGALGSRKWTMPDRKRLHRNIRVITLPPLLGARDSNFVHGAREGWIDRGSDKKWIQSERGSEKKSRIKRGEQGVADGITFWVCL